MPSGYVTVNKFLGLNLAQDARQFPQPTLIAGRNVLIDAQGPYSAFAQDLISEAMLDDPEKLKTFRVETYIIIATVGAFLRYDQATERYYSLFEFADTGEDYPWSMALVGGVYYFAKFGVGSGAGQVISYNPTTMAWRLNTLGAVTDAVYGVCASGGRLIIQSRNLDTWSALDDGTDVTTSVVTRAGAQSRSVTGGGEPLGIFETTAGFMSFSKTGIANYTLVNSTIPFRYDRIETTDLPLNPFAIATLSQGKICYLSKIGFLITQGVASTSYANSTATIASPLQPYQPIMSEYFTRLLFKTLDLSVQTIVQLNYNPDRQWLMVSFSSAANPYVYTYAYVLSITLDQWGVFNDTHYALGEFDLATGPYAGFNFGFVGSNSQLHKFIEIPRRQVTAQSNFDIYYRPALDPPIRITTDGVNETTYFGCMVLIDTVPPNIYGTEPGIYAFTELADTGPEPTTITPITFPCVGYDTYTSEDWGVLVSAEDWNALTATEDWLAGAMYLEFPASGGMAAEAVLYYYAQVPPNYTSIDAYADIGLMRLADQQYADRLSQMNLLSLGTDIQTIFDYLDYMTTDELDEDWSAISAAEDWGNDLPTSNDFITTVRGTIDGTNTFEDNEIIDPPDAYLSGGAIIYPINITGLWHRVRVEATETNQSFHLKTLELQGILAGRLF